MKIWLSKNSDVPIREQLATQITLGIISGDLPTGERLPSTRELARRFQIHANTVSSAYGQLSEKGLIEFKKGSGFYVCETENAGTQGQFELDALIVEFFRAAQSRGFSRNEIQESLQKWIDLKVTEEVFVVESDEHLRAILIEEISAATNFHVAGTSFEQFGGKHLKQNQIVTAMIGEKSKIETVLPSDKRRVFLVPRSVSGSMQGETRPDDDNLIVVVSGWDNFLLLAKTVLVAANIEADAIVLFSTGDADWRNALKNASIIICDSLTAKQFSGDQRVRAFHLIADASINELKDFAGN